MRRKFALLQASPRRLLSLLLIQSFVAFAVPYVDGSSAELYTGLGKVKLDRIPGGTPLIKSYQLISRCTKERVQMNFKKKINALGHERSMFTLLNFMSDPTGSGKVRIKGYTIKKFLCFNKHGKLINRTNGDNARCKFNEIPDHNYIRLQSVANAQWFVGFSKRGRKLKGYAKRRDNCFKFLKVEMSPEFIPLSGKVQEAKFVNSAGNSLEQHYQRGR